MPPDTWMDRLLAGVLVVVIVALSVVGVGLPLLTVLGVLPPTQGGAP